MAILTDTPMDTAIVTVMQCQCGIRIPARTSQMILL